MEVGKEELHPDSPSKGPSCTQQSIPEKVSPEKVLEMEEKSGEGKDSEPKSVGDEKCQELEPQDRNSSPDKSGCPSEVDHRWKSSSDNHPRGPGTLHNGCNEKANRNSYSRRHQRKPQCHGYWRTQFHKRPRSPEPENTQVYKYPRLRQGLVITLRSLSQAIQVDLVEAQRQQTCASLSGNQLALLTQLLGPLTGLVQTFYSMASQAAYVFPLRPG